MNLSTSYLIVAFVISCAHFTLEDNRNVGDQNKVNPQNLDDLARDRRSFFFKKKKPGPFATIFGLIIDQHRDTKATINKVTSTVNAQFVDENEIKPQRQLDDNATTTEGPYRITRNELFRILRRNIKGLQRLLKIELTDALSRPKPTYKDIHTSSSRTTKVK